MVGGMLGTCGRYSVDRLVPGSADFPVSTLLVNLSGAFLIGLLAGVLGNKRRDDRQRLFLGTGVLGGYTTYSLLAADMAEMLRDDRWGSAAAYGVATLVAGSFLAVAGLAVGDMLRRRR